MISRTLHLIRDGSARIVWVVVFGISISACSTAVVPVPLSKAVEQLNQEIKDLGYASLADLAEKPGTVRRGNAERYIRRWQCFYDNPNPTVILGTVPNELTLKAIVTADGKVSITGLPVPTGAISLGASGSAEHTVRWPLQPVTIAALPTIYYQFEMKDLFSTGIPDKILTPEATKRLGELVVKRLNTMQALEAALESLMSGYKKTECGK